MPFLLHLKAHENKMFRYAGSILEALDRIENLMNKFIYSPTFTQNTFKEASVILFPKLKEKRRLSNFLREVEDSRYTPLGLDAWSLFKKTTVHL